MSCTSLSFAPPFSSTRALRWRRRSLQCSLPRFGSCKVVGVERGMGELDVDHDRAADEGGEVGVVAPMGAGADGVGGDRLAVVGGVAGGWREVGGAEVPVADLNPGPAVGGVELEVEGQLGAGDLNRSRQDEGGG